MDQEYWVESDPPAQRKRPVQQVEEQQSRLSPFFALFVFVPTLLFLLLLQAVSDALSNSFARSFWVVAHPWLIVACSIMLIISGGIVTWHIYLAWHRLVIQHYERKGRAQQLQLAAEVHQDAKARENERLELEREKSAGEREIALEKIRLEQMRATLEHERLMAAQQAIILSAGQSVIFPQENYHRIDGQGVPAALSGRGQAKELAQRAESRLEELPALETLKQEQEEGRETPVPVAPVFWDIVNMISTERMPLCFTVDENPDSPFYGETVPQFGTIDDLLSLCVIGKPGRGKTVLLMYYALILSVYGAETHIFDPHGYMGELALLHGHVLPGMPETARIYYYDRREEMEGAVKLLNRELADRDRLYRPHMENGELVNHKVKHPLLILADELPILADFDEQLKAEYKERNREKPVEKREEVPSLIYLIRRTVLEARKWRMFFIGSSQSIDASILPTKVTDALNSRIVFYSSDRKARLVGLDAEVIKRLLPVIRRAGPGMTIYDCARWDAPRIGAIPFVAMEDMLRFLGVDLQSLTESWVAGQTGLNGMDVAPGMRPVRLGEKPDGGQSVARNTSGQMLQNTIDSALVSEQDCAQEDVADRPGESAQGAQNRAKYRLTDQQAAMFCQLYPDIIENKDECLRKIGANTAYRAHANELILQHNLMAKKRRA